MTTIWDVYQFILFVADKPRGGFVSPEEVASALDVGQQWLFDHYWGTGKDMSQASIEALSPFGKTEAISSSTAGVLTFPANFSHLRSFTTGTGSALKQYREMWHDEVGDAFKSVLYPFSKRPRFMMDNVAIQLFPQVATTGSISYYTKPATPVIGYTVVGNDIAYNPSASVQLGFLPQYWIEIIQRALPYLAVNLSTPDLLVAARQFENSQQPA